MRKSNKAKATIDLVRPNAAGIDIASEVHYVSVPEDRDAQSVRKFSSFTEDLHKMAQWLKECNIETIAMESTGIYWIQPYLILEEYGFEVFLVNARPACSERATVLRLAAKAISKQYCLSAVSCIAWASRKTRSPKII